MSNPLTGARYMVRGAQLITRPGIRRWVAIPLGINTLLFALLIWFGASRFGTLIDWLVSYLPGWLDWLRFLLWPVFALVALVVTFFGFSLLANLIGAPFNGLLAEAVERHLTGRPAETGGSWRAALAGLLPALRDEARKLLYFGIWAVPLGILFLIPGVNLIAPPLWLLFSAWMLALEYNDYPMGNHGLGFAEQRRTLRRQRGLSMGFGGAALLATLLPVANFLVMPVAVAGATAMWVERLGATET